MKQINVTANELKTLVEAGKTLDQICEHFKDEKDKALPKATAKRYLKECNLTLKKTRRSKFVLVDNDNLVNKSEVEVTEDEGANV